MAELEGGGSALRQEGQEGAETRDVLLHEGRKLEEHRSLPRTEDLRGLEEVRHGVGRVRGEALLVGDPARGLKHEREVVGDLAHPALEQLPGRHAVERVVDLDRLEALGVEAEHVRFLQVLGVERALPFLVAVSARPHEDLHG